MHFTIHCTMSDILVIRDVPVQRVASLRASIDNFKEQGDLWMDLFEVLGRTNTQCAAPSLTVLHSMSPIEVEVCAPIKESDPDISEAETPKTKNKVITSTLPAQHVAVVTHRGLMQEIPQAYERMAALLKKHNITRTAGQPSREVYVEIPEDVFDSTKKWHVELHYPVPESVAIA